MADERPWSAADLREFDRLAIHALGLPELVLMENAGAGAARVIRSRAVAGEPDEVRRVLVLCGRGNNGADGAVVARHLDCAGWRAWACYTVEQADQRGSALVQRQVLTRLGLARSSATPLPELEAALAGLGPRDVLVDALLGTGTRGALSESLVAWLERAGLARGPLRVALDLPSGLEPDSGLAHPATFSADLTLTFAAEKLGFANPAAHGCLGQVCVVGLGAPLDLAQRLKS
jgi:NAD(P)H-hydrate epimerase